MNPLTSFSWPPAAAADSDASSSGSYAATAAAAAAAAALCFLGGISGEGRGSGEASVQCTRATAAVDLSAFQICACSCSLGAAGSDAHTASGRGPRVRAMSARSGDRGRTANFERSDDCATLHERRWPSDTVRHTRRITLCDVLRRRVRRRWRVEHRCGRRRTRALWQACIFCRVSVRANAATP